MARAAGADQAMIDQNTRQLPIILDLIEQDAPTDAIAQAIREMGEQQLRDAGMDPGTEESRRQVEGVVEMQTQQLASAWMRWFIKHDPREALRRVRCPVLAINGSLDTQVPAAANLAEIRKALEEGGNTSIRIVELEGLNHLFQTAKTGALDEYGRIEETFSPAALNLMSDWIRSVAGLTN
jgi:fermentation-respiration switch protein FrsA (DUF1100 family)